MRAIIYAHSFKAVYATIFVTLIEVIVHVVTMLLIDKVGRRFLLLLRYFHLFDFYFILVISIQSLVYVNDYLIYLRLAKILELLDLNFKFCLV